MAAFMSKEIIRGLGLTVTELMLARMTAIRYAGKKDKPAHLVEMMVSLWSRLPDHDAPGSRTDKGVQTGQLFPLGSRDSLCSRRRGGQQFG